MSVRSRLLVFALVCICVWAVVAGAARCRCPDPPGYGPVPRYERVTSSLCAMVIFAPRSNLSEPIKAGCELLARTQLHESLTRTSEFASTLQQLFNDTLLPNMQRGRELRNQWAAATSPTLKTELEQQWSGLANVTARATAAAVDLLAGSYAKLLSQLMDNLTSATRGDFMSAHTGCANVNRTGEQLQAEKAYWEDVLKNCTLPEVCTQAKEMIANVTTRIEALAPSIEFCAAFSPLLAQAYDELLRLSLALLDLRNGQDFVLAYLRQIEGAIQRCSDLSSNTFPLFLQQAIISVNEADQAADVVGTVICSLEAVPC